MKCVGHGELALVRWGPWLHAMTRQFQTRMISGHLAGAFNADLLMEDTITFSKTLFLSTSLLVLFISQFCTLLALFPEMTLFEDREYRSKSAVLAVL